MSFDPKAPAGKEFFTFDFKHQLPEGVTISTATWTVTVKTGVDANPSAMKSGAVVIQGTKVSQMLQNGLAGVLYCNECKATCSDGQEIVLADELLVQDLCLL